MAALQRWSLATRDPEEALPVLRPLYSGLSLAARPDAFRFDIDAAAAGPIRTLRYRLTGPRLAGGGDGAGSLTVLHVLHDTGIRLQAGRTEFDPVKPLLIPRSMHAQWDDAEFGVLNLDLDAVERFARRLAGSDAFQLEFTGFNPMTRELSQFWTATVRTLNRDLLRESDAMESPLVRAAAFEQLALALLRVFPNSLLDGRAEMAAASVPAAVRRATVFMDEHLADPITVADVATAARLSGRGLSAAFRRHLGTSPSAYLRAARLAAAHDELRRSDPGSDTVAAIARRWGFNNAGRFADAYRDAFGASPATTLRG